MIGGVPQAALAWGLLGLVPFVYGAAMLLAAPATLPGFGLVEPGPAGGVQVLERFGAAILAYMGGCLWGFASSGREPGLSSGREPGLSSGREPGLLLLGGAAVPAALAFLAIGSSPALSCIWLAFGFVVLQGIDVLYARAGVAPAYWLSLRLPLTAVVMACLLVGALYG